MRSIKQNFICIGAQKAGTTTLAEILDQHSRICVPPIKETKFFLFDADYAKGKSFYDSYFTNYRDQTAVGEFDPDYMLFPFTAKRIAETLGSDVRIMAVLRHPADRAYSHYLMTRRKGLEKLDFRDALAEEADRKGDIKTRKIYAYLERGYYGRQLEQYMQVFPRENFLFLEFERDFIKNRPEAIRRVQEFLGVPFEALNIDIHSNEAGEPINSTVNELVRKPNFVKRVFKLVLPLKAIRKWLRKVFISKNMQKVSVPRLSEDERRAVVSEYFADDIKLTEKLTGLDLSGWYK